MITMKSALWAVVVLTVAKTAVSDSLVGSMSVPRETYLDSAGKDVHFIWSFNDTHIQVQLTVKTLGWFAFGISPDGRMDQTDAFLAYVNDTTGEPFLEDRWLESNATAHRTFLVRDPIQDWTLLGGVQTTTDTTISAVRALVTCDTERDRPFTRNTLRMIWSYYPTDPTDLVKLPHHKARGVKSMLIFSPSYLRAVPIAGNASVPKIDMGLLMSQVIISNDTVTSSQCRLLQLPPIAKKLHIVKTRPFIQPGNEPYVQLVSAYLCRPTVDGNIAPLPFDCETPGSPALVSAKQNCDILIATWAFGGLEFVYPDDVGMPIDVDHSEKFVMLRVQYDNSAQNTLNDSSGIMLTVQQTLRRYDAGLLTTGLLQYDYQLTIPPNLDSFVFQSHCMDFCTQSSFPSTGINVFAVLPLEQQEGRKIIVRHIRSGKELTPIFSDDNPDAKYQEVQFTPSVTTVFPGDRLIVECTYSTKNNAAVTFGGHGVNDATCLAILSYYPAMNVTDCGSIVDTKKFLEATEYAPVSPSTQSALTDSDMTNSTSIRAYLGTKRTWNDDNVQKLQKFYQDQNQLGICFGSTAESLKSTPSTGFVPAPAKSDICIGRPSVPAPVILTLSTGLSAGGDVAVPAGNGNSSGAASVVQKTAPVGTTAQGTSGSTALPQVSLMCLIIGHFIVILHLSHRV